MEKDLRRVAREYVAVLQAIMIIYGLESDPPSHEEILELVSTTFAEGICEAIDQLDES
jgi:hypothetical protein